MKKFKYLIRKLYHLIWFLSLFIFFYIPKVNGAVDVSATFNGQQVDTTWTIASNGSKNGSTRFISNNDITGNFIYADVCTTGYEPTIWVTQDIEGKAITSSKWYKVNIPCYASGYKATVYRQIIYITQVHFDAGNPEIFSIYFTDRIFSNTDYTTYMRLLHLGISDTIPLEDLMYDETTTQTSVLNDILTALRSNSNVDQQILQSNQAIQNQVTQARQQQEQTNQKLDDLNDNITDETSPTVDLTDIQSSDTPVSDLVTLPLSLLNTLHSGLSGVCSNWVLPLPFNHSVLLECFTIADYVGSNVANTIDFAICLFMAYRLILLFIKVFDDITTLSDTYTNWVVRGRF